MAVSKDPNETEATEDAAQGDVADAPQQRTGSHLSQKMNFSAPWATGALRQLHRGIEFIGKHPFATGLFALIGLFGLGLSIVGYKFDRTEAALTTEQISRVETKIDEVRVAVSSSYKVPKIVGLGYDLARELLLREGWAPNKRHWTHGDTWDIKSGNGPIFWARGYWELDSCSGTGLAHCKFEFFDPEQRVLVVVTEGEEAEDGAYHAKVSRVFFDGEKR